MRNTATHFFDDDKRAISSPRDSDPSTSKEGGTSDAGGEIRTCNYISKQSQGSINTYVYLKYRKLAMYSLLPI